MKLKKHLFVSIFFFFKNKLARAERANGFYTQKLNGRERSSLMFPWSHCQIKCMYVTEINN